MRLYHKPTAEEPSDREKGPEKSKPVAAPETMPTSNVTVKADAKTDSPKNQLPAPVKSKPKFLKRLRFCLKMLFSKEEPDLKLLYTETTGTPSAVIAAVQEDSKAPASQVIEAKPATTDLAQPKDETTHTTDNDSDPAKPKQEDTAELQNAKDKDFTVRGDIKLSESSTWILLRVKFSYGLEEPLRRHEIGFIGNVLAIKTEPTNDTLIP